MRETLSLMTVDLYKTMENAKMLSIEKDNMKNKINTFFAAVD